MTPADVTQLVSAVGFPIVACGAMGFYIYKCQKTMTDALNNNTLVLQKLVDKQEEKGE
jgi:O-acetyl-ADP-ribose deacetylase (regulator of RNase III)